MRERSSENLLAIYQPFFSKLLQVFVIEDVDVGTRDMNVVPLQHPLRSHGVGWVAVYVKPQKQRPHRSEALKTLQMDCNLLYVTASCEDFSPMLAQSGYRVILCFYR